MLIKTHFFQIVTNKDAVYYAVLRVEICKQVLLTRNAAV